jgi:hypothetical protein
MARQACADLVNKNMNSDFDWVREALENAETVLSYTQDKMSRMRAAKKGMQSRCKKEGSGSPPIGGGDSQSHEGIGEPEAHEAESAPGVPEIFEPEPKKTKRNLSVARKQFEEFRKKFKGTKGEFESEWDNEWDNFVRKTGKDTEQIAAGLDGWIQRENEWRDKCAEVGAFCPEWPMLSTWTNQQRWNQVRPEPVRRKSSQEVEADAKRARQRAEIEDIFGLRTQTK